MHFIHSSGVFQVLQQESVELDSLDEVDSSGKALLDRLTMPIIFPDGYKHSCCFKRIVFRQNLYFTSVMHVKNVVCGQKES